MLSVCGHLAYELAAGVGVPLAARVGVTAATTGFAATTVVVYRAAGSLPSPRGDRAFAVVNGAVASAVIAHYSSWPRTRRAGLPWLTESEGIRGPLIGPYNGLLYLSAVAAVGGVIENRRAWSWAVGTAVLLVPMLRWATPREYAALLEQAQRRPRWWNRRLADAPVR